MTLLIVSCSSQRTKKIKFNHLLFEIEYPADWMKREDAGSVLFISKFNKIEAALHGDNPNLIIIELDSAEYVNYNFKNLVEYLNGFKQDQVTKNKIILAEDVRKINLKKATVYSLKFKIKKGSSTLFQSHYSFHNNRKYIGLIATLDENSEDRELLEIINSLHIKPIESLEKLLQTNP